MSFNGISSDFWDEPEYKTETHQNVAIHIFSRMDSVGVCPMNIGSVSKKCRISKGKLLKTLEYFKSIEKLIFGVEMNQIWWKSGSFHKLFKGKHSKNQLKNVENLLRKHHFSGVFGDNFAELVSQHYGMKYNLTIPIADYINVYTHINTNVNSKASVQTYDPDIIIEKQNIEYDNSKKPIENLMIWDKTKESDELVEIFSATPGYELEWVKHEFDNKFVPWVSMEPKKAKESLFDYHNGSWADFFKSWLRRGKKNGSYTEYYKSRVK